MVWVVLPTVFLKILILKKSEIYFGTGPVRKKGVDESTLWDLVDSYAQKLEESQKLNFTRWDILNSYVHLNPRIYGSYQGEVNAVKDYIKDRLKWMDDKIGYMDVSGTKNNIAD